MLDPNIPTQHILDAINRGLNEMDQIYGIASFGSYFAVPWSAIGFSRVDSIKEWILEVVLSDGQTEVCFASIAIWVVIMEHGNLSNSMWSG